MNTDRTTKILLTLIAIALWGMLLKPLVAPTPATAAMSNDVTIVGIRIPTGGTSFRNDLPVLVTNPYYNPVRVKTGQ